MFKLVHVHSDGFREPVLAVKEYQTYPSGFYQQTWWAAVLKHRYGHGRWGLVLVSELIIEIID